MRSVGELKKVIVRRIAQLKWQWAGHIARRTDGCWDGKVLHWRPRSGRSVGSPLTRWTDDLVKVTGSRWTDLRGDPLGRPILSSGRHMADDGERYPKLNKLDSPTLSIITV
jgi:hypothetical protein